MNEKVPGPTQVTKCKIRRLNSGILRIFKLREWNLNLNSSDCRASKIICNDSNLDAIPWKLNIENPRFSICVSVWVGRNPPTNLSYGSKDAQENFISFDTNLDSIPWELNSGNQRSSICVGVWVGGHLPFIWIIWKVSF